MPLHPRQPGPGQHATNRAPASLSQEPARQSAEARDDEAVNSGSKTASSDSSEAGNGNAASEGIGAHLR
jgi:hypothetical protein